MIQTEITAERAELNTHAELSKAEETHETKMREFVRTASRYNGNPEKMFKWSENLEAHLYDNAWEKNSKRKSEENVIVLY